jgi:hypothetical protein
MKYTSHFHSLKLFDFFILINGQRMENKFYGFYFPYMGIPDNMYNIFTAKKIITIENFHSRYPSLYVRHKIVANSIYNSLIFFFNILGYLCVWGCVY